MPTLPPRKQALTAPTRDDLYAPVAESTGQMVHPSSGPARRVHSYKMDPALGKRLRKLAHAWDWEIAQAHELAIRQFLAAHEGQPAPEDR